MDEAEIFLVIEREHRLFKPESFICLFVFKQYGNLRIQEQHFNLFHAKKMSAMPKTANLAVKSALFLIESRP